MIFEYNILIKENITYIQSPSHVYKIVLSHPYSITNFDTSPYKNTECQIFN